MFVAVILTIKSVALFFTVELSKDDVELQAALKVIKAAEIEVNSMSYKLFFFFFFKLALFFYKPN